MQRLKIVEASRRNEQNATITSFWKTKAGNPNILCKMAESSVTVDRIRSSNWTGSVPIQLSLAPTSLSSPTMPSPIYVLLSRHTFLHIGLQHAVLRLHKFAPPTFSFMKRVVEEPETTTDEPSEEATGGENQAPVAPSQPTIIYPVCWFEDEDTKLPLRWQVFVGVLWDSLQTKDDALQKNRLPWKIRVHFTNYPSSQLLDLDNSPGGILTTVERTFKNSLKQALVLEYNQNKVALNMTKQSHERIWDAIVTSKYAVYKPIQDDIMADSRNLTMIPIRMLLGPSKPIIQKRCDDHTLTLGRLLALWLPQYFKLEGSDCIPIQSGTTLRVSGVVPSLSTPIIDLWQTLCHPDNFLYIIVTED